MPGMFVSDGKSWKPQTIQMTKLKVSEGKPGEPMSGRLYDVPVIGPDGKPIFIPDPAALDMIHKDHGAEAVEMPLAPFPEDLQMKALQDNQENLNRSIAAMAESIKVLAESMNKGKK